MRTERERERERERRGELIERGEKTENVRKGEKHWGRIREPQRQD
jgi:hypothetical protein